MAPQNGGYLKVDGTKVVDGNGNTVILKGAATGGHTKQVTEGKQAEKLELTLCHSMENFITGFTGHEHEVRAALLEVLGKQKYDHFFSKFMEYFFTASDAQFFASLGLNCVRIPINHRHFLPDLSPQGEIDPTGFALIDRIVSVCADAGIYTILDMHTFPGGQNQGWHSDSGLHRATFWEYADHQDRATNLWVQIAKHYRDNTWVAGYNPMNEPADPQHSNLQAWYERVEKAIREVDSHHILWLDGNTYSMDFSGFKEVLPNCVYAIHDYSTMGFPAGQPYEGTDEQKDILRKQYERKVQFMREHRVPIWNGEFGPVYASPDEADHDKINQQRYNLLGEQLKIYKQDEIHWSIWLYKDIGFQGMVYSGPETPYVKLLKPFFEKEKRLGLNKWGRDDTHVKHIYEPLIQHLKEEIPEKFQRRRYPQHWGLEGHVHRVVREMLFSELLAYEYASYFEGKSMEELDELAASFKFENCVKRDGLNRILQTDAGLA